MKKISSNVQIPSSYRDPSGFIFLKEKTILRQVNLVYRDNYDYLIRSGLYQDLVNSKLIIPHEEINQKVLAKNAYKVLKPTNIPFVSYPYEWCFSQLKDAALATLKIQKKALKYNMILKDGSAFNIQFWRGKPVLIDTLSFQKYHRDQPWIAYRQFCQHFLAPLAIAHYTDMRLTQLQRIYLDGIPLDLASKLLPFKTYCNFSLLSHIHLHAKMQKHFASQSNLLKPSSISMQGLVGIVDNLQKIIQKLKLKSTNTEWADYYSKTNYAAEAFEHKQNLISAFVSKLRPKIAWDLGANTGEFSRIISQKKILTISFDIDPMVVEKNYREAQKLNDPYLLPLILDLTNPSPSLGWENKERLSLVARGPADLVLVLALIHHLAISNNVPLKNLAGFFSQISNNLVIEFVPKDDSQVQKLLTTRKDIFPQYTQEDFEKTFSSLFKIRKKQKIKASKRTLYLMENRKRR